MGGEAQNQAGRGPRWSRWSRSRQDAQGQPQTQGQEGEACRVLRRSLTHVIKDPVLVETNFCINSRKSSATTANAPAHNPHLDPGLIKFTDQGPPRISLEKEKETKRGMKADQPQNGRAALPGTGEVGSPGFPQAPAKPCRL